MVPEIWDTTDKTFGNFGSSFALLPHKRLKKSKFQKNEKVLRDIIILHKCPKNHDHILSLKYSM